MKHFNDLTPDEAERLAFLAEECSEVIQMVSKILRHGWDSVNPLKPEEGSNRARLERELGDLAVAITLMSENRDISQDLIMNNWDRKIHSDDLLKWFHHQ